MRRGHAHAIGRKLVVPGCRQLHFAFSLFQASPYRRRCMPSLSIESPAHPCHRRSRIARALQRFGTPHDGVGLIDRDFADALDSAISGRRPNSFTMKSSQVVIQPGAHIASSRQNLRTHLLRRIVIKTIELKHIAQHPQNLPCGTRLPKRRHHAIESLHPAFGIDKGTGGFGERCDRQQHVSIISLERMAGFYMRTSSPPAPPLQCLHRLLRIVTIQFRLQIHQDIGLAGSGALAIIRLSQSICCAFIALQLGWRRIPDCSPSPACSRNRSGNIGADAVGGLAQNAELRFGNLRELAVPAHEYPHIADDAAPGCRERSLRLVIDEAVRHRPRSIASRCIGSLRRLFGSLRNFHSLSTRQLLSGPGPASRAIAAGATMARFATLVSRSSSTGLIRFNCAPCFTAWRKRCAISGWSLRRVLPMTSADFSREIRNPHPQPGRALQLAIRAKIGLTQAVIDIPAAESSHRAFAADRVLPACCEEKPMRRYVARHIFLSRASIHWQRTPVRFASRIPAIGHHA